MKQKQKKCRHCPNKFTPWLSTQIVCSPECGIKEARAQAKKKKKAREKATRAELKALNRKDLRWQHKLTQAAFNKMRVLEEKKWFKERGLEPECISCGKKDMDWCCGHFKTRGAQPALRYDRKNTYLQCNRYCNMGLSGNINGNKTTRGYIQGLKDRFGGAEANIIIDYCESKTEPIKWKWQQLEEMREEFNRLSRELSKD